MNTFEDQERAERAEAVAHIAEMYQQLNAEHRTEVLITIVAILDKSGRLQNIPADCEAFVMVARALISKTALKAGEYAQ